MTPDVFNRGRNATTQWVFVAILALTCAALAALQYRWTGQITEAERARLRAQLDERVFGMRDDINRAVSESLNAVAPGFGLPRFPLHASISAPPCLFRRSGMLVENNGELKWLERNGDDAPLSPATWPATWGDAARFFNTLSHDGMQYLHGLLIRDVPRFIGAEPQRAANPVVIAELNPDCLIRGVVRPIAALYFGPPDQRDYDLRIVDRATSATIYASTETAVIVPGNADGSVGLLDEPPGLPFGRGERPTDHARAGPEPSPHGPSIGDSGLGGRFRGPPPRPRPGPWILLVRHKSGSLDVLVESTRRRNLAISAAMLLLILAAGSALSHYTRASQRVAELRMNIVAGVSHELRSPLAVIRTAAFNLQRDAFRSRPDQVGRYGELIATESDRLERLIENALRFTAVNTGHEPRQWSEVDVAAIVEAELEFFKDAFATSGMQVTREIENKGLHVAGDAPALRHALRNLIENAVKYGGAAGWIGVSAKSAQGAVEIRVADHGPGIGRHERERIFEPFFRGEHAIQDQIQGAGLGLSLACEIVRVHGGSLSVNGDFEAGAEFVIRLPANAATERAGERANRESA